MKHFPIRRGVLRRTVGHVRAVDGVDLAVEPGRTLGLVGESGSGKSTLGRVLLRLLDPTAGTITFDGTDITKLSERQMRERAPRHAARVPGPVLVVRPAGDDRRQPRRADAQLPRPRQASGARSASGELLRTVRLDPDHRNRYPREFSGGQLQRIAIARALALSPKLLVLDEPVSSLDVSIQADVINLLGDLQDELGLAYLFIAHDLALVRHVSDRIAVMYLGRIVEEGPADEVYSGPKHPYTEALLSAIPVARSRACSAERERIVLEGDIPSPAAPPVGVPVPHPLPLRVRAVPHRRSAGVRDARRHHGGVPPPHRRPAARRRAVSVLRAGHTAGVT